VLVPSASQALDGTVTISLGAKGVVELELVSSGARWGRGPKQDIHSSNPARSQASPTKRGRCHRPRRRCSASPLSVRASQLRSSSSVFNDGSTTRTTSNLWGDAYLSRRGD